MTFSTTSMEVELTEDGILIITPPKGFKGPETLEHAKENINVLKTHFQEKLKGIMALLPEHYVNAKANAYYKENTPEVPIAMVGKSFLKKMIGNFFLSMMASNRPMKIFDDSTEAMNWLEEKISKNPINKVG